MKKILALLIIASPFVVHSQILVRMITPADLPNLVPGYSQVITINQQSLSFAYSLPPAPPPPVDGDTTTETNGPLKYGIVLPVSFSIAHGNFTQTTEGKVWTLSIKVLGGAKNLGVTFESVTLTSNAELYLYNESKTVLRGPIKATNFQQPAMFTTGDCKDSVITVYVIERNSSSFQSSFNITQLVAGYIDFENTSEDRLAWNTSCMEHVQCYTDKMIYAHAIARISEVVLRAQEH